VPFAINYYDDCVSCRNILLASSTNIYIEASQDLLQLMELCRDVSSYSDMRFFLFYFPCFTHMRLKLGGRQRDWGNISVEIMRPHKNWCFHMMKGLKSKESLSHTSIFQINLLFFHMKWV
jgi:hypothetical protein